MPLLPTISTFFILLSACLVAFGWRAIINDKKLLHKRLMVSAAISALSFFIIYSTRTVFIGNTSFGGPDHLAGYYKAFLFFHISLATIGAIFGLVTLFLAMKRNIKVHRKIGPITSVIWFFTALTGVAVYLLLYILYEGGETTSMIKAILGS